MVTSSTATATATATPRHCTPLRLNKVSVQISELPMTSTVLALWESGVNREPAGCCFIVHGLKIQEQVDFKSEARTELYFQHVLYPQISVHAHFVICGRDQLSDVFASSFPHSRS
jgi:hypothetical protein